MSEEIGQHLGDIASLLRRRVDLAERAMSYQEAKDQRQQEKGSQMKERLEALRSEIRAPEIPKFDNEAREARVARMEERQEQNLQIQRAFQEQLIAELQRHTAATEKHNDLIAQVLLRLER